MHSSNNTVTQAGFNGRRRQVTAVFHAQATDLKRNSGVGTFFTNLCRELVFTALRMRGARDSTDLSTTRVDKPESPFASDSCVTYVMFEARMRRNCEAPRTGDGRHESELGFRRAFLFRLKGSGCAWTVPLWAIMA